MKARDARNKVNNKLLIEANRVAVARRLRFDGQISIPGNKERPFAGTRDRAKLSIAWVRAMSVVNIRNIVPDYYSSVASRERRRRTTIRTHLQRAVKEFLIFGYISDLRDRSKINDRISLAARVYFRISRGVFISGGEASACKNPIGFRPKRPPRC